MFRIMLVKSLKMLGSFFSFNKIDFQYNLHPWIIASSFNIVVIDTNDRYLRKITIGQSPTEKGKTREVCCFN